MVTIESFVSLANLVLFISSKRFCKIPIYLWTLHVHCDDVSILTRTEAIIVLPLYYCIFVSKMMCAHRDRIYCSSWISLYCPAAVNNGGNDQLRWWNVSSIPYILGTCVVSQTGIGYAWFQLSNISRILYYI